jgi:hypothetical protein
MPILKVYNPSPTARAFHKDNSKIKGIMGPVGSGKSVTCCFEILFRGIKQKPNSLGVRKTRWAIIRNTYPELKSTSIKTWQQWFPQEIAPINFGAPITSHFQTVLEDKTMLDMEVLFISLNRPEDIKKLLSLEITGGWINEAREIPEAVFNALQDRLGRYPPKSEVELTWKGIIMDTNPPEFNHWYYQLAEVVKPNNFNFYKQPPALFDETDPVKIQEYDAEGNGYILNMDADNLDNLQTGGDYWLGSIGSKTRVEVQVYQQGKYGKCVDGRVVYPEFKNELHHINKIINYNKSKILYLGWDFGLTPACIIFQEYDNIIRILEEMTSEDMGITQFGEIVKKHIEHHYGILRQLNHRCGADPAGNQRAQTDEQTCIKILKQFGFKIYAAPTQNTTKRREAVAEYLRYRHNDIPRFKIGKKSPVLLQGFLGDYRYKRLQINSAEHIFKDVPEKNKTSHIHDALQYGVMVINKTQQNTRKLLLG